VNIAFDLNWIYDRFGTKTSRYSSHHRGDKDLNPDIKINEDLKPAAVLIPLVKRANEITVLLTKRTDSLSVHAGQISFPGGRVEEFDKSHEDTALRETEEEIGLSRERIEVIGRLDDYIARTNFRITPIVAIVSPPFELKVDPTEVAEAFEVPLPFFLDPSNHQRHLRIEHGKERHVYAMPYLDYYIWGITAGMLFNLYEFLMEKSDPIKC
jgi:8-oxo-dGTP pyrophosphatase MutT (NUDIX family)